MSLEQLIETLKLYMAVYPNSGDHRVALRVKGSNYEVNDVLVGQFGRFVEIVVNPEGDI